MTSATSSANSVPLVTRSPVTTAMSGSRALAAAAQRMPHDFGVSVPTEMFDRIATVDDVARVVEKLVGRGSA